MIRRLIRWYQRWRLDPEAREQLDRIEAQTAFLRQLQAQLRETARDLPKFRPDVVEGHRL